MYLLCMALPESLEVEKKDLLGCEGEFSLELLGDHSDVSKQQSELIIIPRLQSWGLNMNFSEMFANTSITIQMDRPQHKESVDKVPIGIFYISAIGNIREHSKSGFYCFYSPAR